MVNLQPQSVFCILHVHQKIAIIKLGAFSLSLVVKDINASKSFYEKLVFTKFGGEINQNWLIMKNESTIIGLFQGMFDKSMMTFNPGWDSDAKKLEAFDDVREIKKAFIEKGIAIGSALDESEAGPAHFVITDPDGNTIFIDQHV